MAKKKEVEIPRPVLARRCQRCGKIWIACHPKDDRVLCERCRDDGNNRERAVLGSGRDNDSLPDIADSGRNQTRFR